MTREVTIIGTGKMARDVGSFLINRGYSITWVSRDQERLQSVEKFANKIFKRLSRISEVEASKISQRFSLLINISHPLAPVVIESTVEDLAIKQQAIQSIAKLANDDTLIFSGSSSFLPDEISNRTMGMHFFYPTELTGLVELVVASNTSNNLKQRAEQFVQDLELKCLLQNEQNGFAVNRLLLPLQNQVMSSLMSGVPAQTLDECSRSDLLPHGQLALMDSVGLPTILESVKNYSKREREQGKYKALLEGLAELVNMGKIGKASGNGLLDGGPLPWAPKTISGEEAMTLKNKLHSTFVGTCLCFEDNGELTREELELVLSNVFGAQKTIAECLEKKQ